MLFWLADHTRDAVVMMAGGEAMPSAPLRTPGAPRKAWLRRRPQPFPVRWRRRRPRSVPTSPGRALRKSLASALPC